MKRLLLCVSLLILFALSCVRNADAGHAVVGAGQIIHCECSTPLYTCYDDSTDAPLPMCKDGGGFGHGHRVR